MGHYNNYSSHVGNMWEYMAFGPHIPAFYQNAVSEYTPYNSGIRKEYSLSMFIRVSFINKWLYLILFVGFKAKVNLKGKVTVDATIKRLCNEISQSSASMNNLMTKAMSQLIVVSKLNILILIPAAANAW